MAYGVYIRFQEGHGRWLKDGFPTEQAALDYAFSESMHWSVSTHLEVWEKPVVTEYPFRHDVLGTLPRIPEPDE